MYCIVLLFHPTTAGPCFSTINIILGQHGTTPREHTYCNTQSYLFHYLCICMIWSMYSDCDFSLVICLVIIFPISSFNADICFLFPLSLRIYLTQFPVFPKIVSSLEGDSKHYAADRIILLMPSISTGGTSCWAHRPVSSEFTCLQWALITCILTPFVILWLTLTMSHHNGICWWAWHSCSNNHH